MWKWNDGTDYLMHHGIKGQKWGIRNGPPYPLRNKKWGLDVSNLPLIKSRMSEDEELNCVNPSWRNGHRCGNCVFCVTAYEMRKRGYDVVAKNIEDNRGLDPETFEKFFDVNIYDVTNWTINRNPLSDKAKQRIESAGNSWKLMSQANKSKEIARQIFIEMPNGSRGLIGGTYLNGLSGHVQYWEKDFGGSIHIKDPQSGTEHEYLFTFDNVIDSYKPGKVCICRLDNARIATRNELEMAIETRQK